MLTDAKCRNATCPPYKARARFTDAAGLYLEVSPAGAKRWFWKIYRDGKESRLALGSYPDVSLTAARKARDAAKLNKSEGRDPILIRKVEKLMASTQTLMLARLPAESEPEVKAALGAALRKVEAALA